MSIKKYCFLLFALILPGFLLGQDIKEGESLDKVIAVVGSESITLSDLESQIAIITQQNPEFRSDDEEFRKKVLDALINEKLVIAKAIEDSIEATDEEVRQGWENFVNEEVRKYGSESRVESVYGMSLARLQFETRELIKKRIIADKIKAQKFGEVKVSPREVEEFYTLYKDSLPVIPDQIELYHIVKNIEASRDSKKETFDLAKRVRDSIVNGANFEEMAARYSGDPGTASSGGDLGWFKKGMLFPEYEKAAFALHRDELSNPVETPFGYHIIQTLDKNKDSILTRHILFRIGQSAEDVDKVKQLLADLRDSVLKYGKSFESLAKDYSDEKETQGFGGLLGKFPLNQIPPQLVDAINAIPEGGISEPMMYMQEPKASYHIIYKKKVIPEHKATVKDDYKVLEQFAVNFKQNKLLLDWIQILRKSIYWEIKG